MLRHTVQPGAADSAPFCSFFYPRFVPMDSFDPFQVLSDNVLFLHELVAPWSQLETCKETTSRRSLKVTFFSRVRSQLTQKIAKLLQHFACPLLSDAATGHVLQIQIEAFVQIVMPLVEGCLAHRNTHEVSWCQGQGALNTPRCEDASALSLAGCWPSDTRVPHICCAPFVPGLPRLMMFTSFSKDSCGNSDGFSLQHTRREKYDTIRRF